MKPGGICNIITNLTTIVQTIVPFWNLIFPILLMKMEITVPFIDSFFVCLFFGGAFPSLYVQTWQISTQGTFFSPQLPSNSVTYADIYPPNSDYTLQMACKSHTLWEIYI